MDYCNLKFEYCLEFRISKLGFYIDSSPLPFDSAQGRLSPLPLVRGRGLDEGVVFP
jgi:hypothetical protein